MKKVIIVISLLFTLQLCVINAEAYSNGVVCSVGGVEYESLDNAVKDIVNGGITEEILLLSDTVLNVGSINAPVTINGDGHAVSIPAQSSSGSGALNINSTLNFRNTVIRFSNPNNWSAVIGESGKLILLENSDCAFTVCGIYTSPGAEITVDASKMRLVNMNYTCMMAESFGELSIKNGSEFVISAPVNINGITGFNINVDASDFIVRDCKRQGLVKCGLFLSNGASADISNNGTGYNMYSNNVLTVNEGTSLTMNGNTSSAVLMQGRSTVNIKSGGNFNCSDNGEGWLESNTDNDYGSKAVINIGWYSAKYIYTTGTLNIENGANVNISNNYTRAISNYGTAFIGNGTTIYNNGMLKADENSVDRRIERGGGIKNNGSITIAQGVKVYNNHASVAADDIFNFAEAKITLPEVEKGLILGTEPDTNDCGETISGWYLDKEGSRWKAHGTDGLYTEIQQPGEYSEQLEMKAAHGILTAPDTGEKNMTVLWIIMAMALFVIMIRKNQKKIKLVN